MLRSFAALPLIQCTFLTQPSLKAEVEYTQHTPLCDTIGLVLFHVLFNVWAKVVFRGSPKNGDIYTNFIVSIICTSYRFMYINVFRLVRFVSSTKRRSRKTIWKMDITPFLWLQWIHFLTESFWSHGRNNLTKRSNECAMYTPKGVEHQYHNISQEDWFYTKDNKNSFFSCSLIHSWASAPYIGCGTVLTCAGISSQTRMRS